MTRLVSAPEDHDDDLELSDRQRMVLRSLVAAYIAGAVPVGSGTVSSLLPVALSSASVRNTLGELCDRGLLEQPHPSSGRLPTDRALAFFVDQLMDEPELGDYERRSLRHSFEGTDAAAVVALASELLSQHARQLGFVLAPKLDRVRLQHLSLVRLGTDRLLVVLVSRTGRVHRRVLDQDELGEQAELDRIAAALNERIAGRTLSDVRVRLATELRGLRNHASDVVTRALTLGLRALDVDAPDAPDLVLGTRLALLDQPEFNDPERLRELFAAIETGEDMIRILDRVLERSGVSVAVGGEQLDMSELRHCAVVAAPYGREGEEAQGVLGVIGPSRMDYRRVIPLVDYCSQLVSRKLGPAEEPVDAGAGARS